MSGTFPNSNLKNKTANIDWSNIEIDIEIDISANIDIDIKPILSLVCVKNVLNTVICFIRTTFFGEE